VRNGVVPALLAAAVVTLMAGLTTLPAAADTNMTDGTVVITGGALRITAPADAGVLGKRGFNTTSGTVRGSLGRVR
jgi:hypothetical protein